MVILLILILRFALRMLSRLMSSRLSVVVNRRLVTVMRCIVIVRRVRFLRCMLFLCVLLIRVLYEILSLLISLLVLCDGTACHHLRIALLVQVKWPPPTLPYTSLVALSLLASRFSNRAFDPSLLSPFSLLTYWRLYNMICLDRVV